MKKKPVAEQKTGLPQAVNNKSSLPVPVDSDPLQQYLRDVSRYPIIDPEEQQAMAKEMREKGDIKIAKALVTTNLRLVVKIAMEYRSSYANILDLIQEGNIGLMKAVSNYDPYRGTRLTYYASWWIRSYILKFLLDNFRLVKVGTTQAQKKLFYNLMKERERLEAQGINATPKLLAEKLDVKEKEVKEMSLRLSASGNEASLDQPLSSETASTPMDLLESDAKSPDSKLAHEQMRALLASQLGDFAHILNEKERLILQERLLSENPQTLQKIADQFSISRERARQIEAKVIEKLRDYMASSLELDS